MTNRGRYDGHNITRYAVIMTIFDKHYNSNNNRPTCSNNGLKLKHISCRGCMFGAR